MNEEAIAFHEAGHAVAMRVLHRRIREVSIVADHDSAGRVVPRTQLNVFPALDELFALQSNGKRSKRRDSLELGLRRHRARCQDMIAIVLAGPLSVAKLTGTDKPFRNDSDARQLKFLFAELGLEGKPLKDHLEKAVSQATEIVESHWEAVESIATELRRRKKLSGAAVDRLIANRE